MNPAVAAALRRIGVDPEAPSVDGLKALHRGWVEHVPYESVWIHMGERWSIEPFDSLDRVARLSRGGYCYQLNGALSIVLDELGYRVMSFRDEPVEMAVFDQRHQFLSTSPDSSFAGVVTAQLPDRSVSILDAYSVENRHRKRAYRSERLQRAR